MPKLSQTIVGICGNITSICLFLSPAPTFYKIFKMKSTEEFSGVPYVCTLLNCFLWLFYGSPWVKQGVLVITINGGGAVIEITYLLAFFWFARDRKVRRDISIMVGAVCLFFALVVLVNMLAVHRNKSRELIVGVLCVVVGTAMYASPLSVMKTVIKTKSTKYMPFLLSLFATFNGILWTAYALIGMDIFITVPNAIGVLLGLAQLILYACYCRSPGAEAEEVSEQKRITISGQTQQLDRENDPKLLVEHVTGMERV